MLCMAKLETWDEGESQDKEKMIANRVTNKE